MQSSFTNWSTRGAILLLAIGTVGSALLLSQQDRQQPASADRQASLVGTVTDPSGAIIAGANIDLRSSTSGALYQTQSNQRGDYRFSNLTSGRYQISVTFPGFSTYVGANIQLNSPGMTRHDVRLRVSAPADRTEVSSGTASAKPPLPPPPPPAAPARMPAREIRSQAVGGARNRDALEQLASKSNYREQESSARRARRFDPNTEQYGAWVENDFISPGDEPLSTFGVDVDTASYSNVRRFLQDGQLPPPESVRIEELINYFTYDYPAPKRGEPVSLTTQVTFAPWNSSHKLLLAGLRTPSIADEDLPPSNLTFLVDVSGSMSSPDKLPLVQTALKMLARQMRSQDSVAMVVYAGAAGVVLPPTRGDRTDAILEAIDRLQAGGSTNGAGGIRLAYDLARRNFDRKGNNRVILATDGDFNVGVSSDDELVRLIENQRDSGVFLSVLSFGTGNLKDSKMEKLADHGNGNYAYIDSLSEARKVFVEQMGATLVTVAKDVKLQIEFNPAQVKAYRLIGYENRLLNPEDFNDDTKDAGDLGAGHQVTAFYEIIPVGSTETGRVNVDDLRYQPARDDRPAPLPLRDQHPGELAWLKLRYKEPQSSQSKLLQWEVQSATVNFERASRELRFAAAVAEYGLLLRQSAFAANANFEHVMKTASGALGSDLNGHRTAFLDLVRTATRLAPLQHPARGQRDR